MYYKENKPMKVTVIGCGRWGSTITWYLDSIGNTVTLYGRATSPHMQQFMADRTNDFLRLPESITLTNDLDCVKDAEVIVISVNSQGLQKVFDELAPYQLKNKIFILCMKGIEISTGRRLSQVAEDNLDPSNRIAVWLGPGHVQTLYKGVPTCMVIDSADEETKRFLVDSFSSDLIRFYYGTDLIGNEIGGAAKNVMGIAAGMLDGVGKTQMKGPLMSRGTYEVGKLLAAMGGNEMSAYGLCHLGDYEATLFSEHSHNRRFGEMFVKGEKFDKLAEGYYTADAMVRLADKYHVELPITRAVYDILYNGADIDETLNRLFTRQIKPEF